MTFAIKENDTRPAYMAVLKDNFGEPGEGPIDLTNAATVSFIMRQKGLADTELPKVKRNCVIQNPKTDGIVLHAWQAGDTNESGVYNVEFEINWVDGGVETVPNDGYLDLEVTEDLG